MTKSTTLQVRLDPLNMAKLDELAKERGVNRSEMLRQILTLFVKPSRLDSETGAITWNKHGVAIVQADGEVIDVTPEELAARE